jgi:16S rRNA (guanine1516-N2)-methyltransferase
MPACAILNSSLRSMPVALARQIVRTGLPGIDAQEDAVCILEWVAETLELRTRQGEALRAEWQRPVAAGIRQPFTRALAPARNGMVIDATAGLGGDSLQLALLAGKVISVERHPVVFTLLAAAIQNAVGKGWPAAAKITPRFGDAVDIIARLPAADVIFIDPMFPPKRKSSALPPKAVRILRDLVGDDQDSDALFDAARTYAVRRVIVKRPLHAPPMAADAIAVHTGKVIRYEVYEPIGSPP